MIAMLEPDRARHGIFLKFDSEREILKIAKGDIDIS